MPIVGHAFVGLATATCVRPLRSGSVLAAYWTTIVVGLAYLPDIVNQVLKLLGMADQTVATHSMLFAIIASVIVSGILVRFCSISFRTIFGVTLLSIAGHDVLDFLQSSGRQPLWPISPMTTPDAWQVIPHTIISEVALFGASCFIVVAVVTNLRRASLRDSDALEVSIDLPVSPVGKGGAEGVALQNAALAYRHAWGNRVLVLCVLCCAFGTHYLRGVRERDYESARALLAQHDYHAALIAADRARRWPSTAKSGRVEYLLAEGYAGLGDRVRAEDYYKASITADPYYFWATADLAVFYASSDEPVEQRRRHAAPYVEKLHADFSAHAHLNDVLAKIDRRLAQPSN